MSDTAETSGLVFHGLGKIYEVLAPWGYTLMRFSAGAALVYHGYAKLFAGFASVVAKNILTPLGFPFPSVWAYFLGILVSRSPATCDHPTVQVFWPIGLGVPWCVRKRRDDNRERECDLAGPGDRARDETRRNSAEAAR